MEEFLPLEIEFLAEAKNLPEEYDEYFLPPLDDGLRIPYKDNMVGDIEIRLFQTYVYIKIGDHTELRIESAKEAVNYLREVLTDQIVFHFQDEVVEYFRADEFESLSEADWNYYVWSGPFPYAYLKM